MIRSLRQRPLLLLLALSLLACDRAEAGGFHGGGGGFHGGGGHHGGGFHGGGFHGGGFHGGGFYGGGFGGLNRGFGFGYPGFFGSRYGYFRRFGYGYGLGYGGFGYGGFGYPMAYPMLMVPTYPPPGVNTPPAVMSTVRVPLASGEGTVLIDVIRGDRAPSQQAPYAAAPRPRAAPKAAVAPQPDAQPVVNVSLEKEARPLVKEHATPEELYALLYDEDYDLQAQAAERLLALGTDGRQYLLKAARSDDAVARTIGLWGLGHGIPAPEELELIARGMSDSVVEVRRQSVEAVGNLSPVARDALCDSLLAALGDDDEEVRGAASKVTARMGEKMIPTLLALLEADKEIVREAAGRALIRIGQPAIPSLTTALTSGKSHVRYWAAYSLGEMGQPAVAMLSTLETMASQDPDSTVRYYAVSAVRKLASL